MRGLLISVVALSLGNSAAAQTRIGVKAGGAGMSLLVRDSIVKPFTVKPDLAFSAGFWVEHPLDSSYTVSAGLGTAWSNLSRHEAGVTTEVITLTTWTPSLTLSRVVYQTVRVYGRAGVIVYRADRTESNLFREGGPVLPLVGFGATVDHELGEGLRLTLDLGYDVHRFTTQSLRDAGFQGQRVVHRVALTIGLSRTT
jgi:hypothetical protein